MPTVKEIEAYLFSLAPKELALSWDKVGLLVGQTQKPVRFCWLWISRKMWWTRQSKPVQN